MAFTEESVPVTYASFWNRFVAAFIDGLIIVVPVTIIGRLFLSDIPLVKFLFNLVAGWLYFALQMAGPNMATVGKKAMRIKVTDLEGNRISFGQATARHFATFLSAIIIFIGYFMMLWSPKSQTLHDMIAGTLVIQE